MLKLVMPVAFEKSTPPAPVTATATVSMFLIEAGVTVPVITANSSSVPAPPSNISPEFSVTEPAVERPASNVSSPSPPVNLFVPVVSDLKIGLLTR